MATIYSDMEDREKRISEGWGESEKPIQNGKMERSHREDQKRFYSLHSFFSLADFEKQLAVHNRRFNILPIRPLHWLSPTVFLVQYL